MFDNMLLIISECPYTNVVHCHNYLASLLFCRSVKVVIKKGSHKHGDTPSNVLPKCLTKLNKVVIDQCKNMRLRTNFELVP